MQKITIFEDKPSRLIPFIKRTFGEEGSFQKHPKDSGNYYKGELYGTIWGITARDHFATFWKCYELWNNGYVNESRQVAQEFYRKSRYWDSDYEMINDSSLAFRIWDFGVNAGVVTSIKLLQQTLNTHYKTNLKIDGVFGIATLQTVNKYSDPDVCFKLKPDELIQGETECYTLYVQRLERYYRSLSNFFSFGKGWISRAKRVFNGCPDLYEKITAYSHE